MNSETNAVEMYGLGLLGAGVKARPDGLGFCLTVPVGGTRREYWGTWRTYATALGMRRRLRVLALQRAARGLADRAHEAQVAGEGPRARRATRAMMRLLRWGNRATMQEVAA